MQKDPDQLDILYECDDFLAINKNPGLSLLKDRNDPLNLWDDLKARLTTKPLLVHRLDKGTSGVLLIAKNRMAQSHLTSLFQKREITKQYIACVAPCPQPSSALITIPLMKGRKSRYRLAGKREDITLAAGASFPKWTIETDKLERDKKIYESQTSYRVYMRAGKKAFLSVHPLTGRTHQIRVHLSWLGWPIEGDYLYNKDCADNSDRLFLHCRKLVFLWRNNSRIKITAPLPDEFKELMSLET